MPPAHKPTSQNKKQAESLSGVGLPHDDIARIIGIDPKTLRKHYAEELAIGSAKALAAVSGKLFFACEEGNMTAIIFYLKTRGKGQWREAEPEESEEKAAPMTFNFTVNPAVGEVKTTNAKPK